MPVISNFAPISPCPSGALFYLRDDRTHPVGSYFVRRAHNNFLRPRHKVCPKPWFMYPKAWFTYPKAWFIYPKPWDKLCAGVTPTFSGENVNLFCRRKKVKILVGLKRCPVGHNGRSARPFSQDGVCVSPWGVALLAPILTFLTIGGFTLRKFGGAKLLITVPHCSRSFQP